MALLNEADKVFVENARVSSIHLNGEEVFFTNLVNNGSFDDGNVNDWVSPATYASSYDGRSKCARLDGRAPDASVTSYYSNIPVVEGYTYRWECWWAGYDVHTYGSIYRPRVRDNITGADLTSGATLSPNNTSTGWQYYEQDFVATSDAVQIIFQNRKSYGYIDGLVIKLISS